jgi:hypothetical protein
MLGNIRRNYRNHAANACLRFDRASESFNEIKGFA